MVDDDPDVRDSLERALGYAGFAVESAPNGTDALASLARRPADLVIMDLLMPVMNGLEACQALRGKGDATPVLVLTARDSVDDRVTGLDAGADDYLIKPFALRELLARVRALLRRTQPEREVIGYSDLTLDLTNHSVTRDGSPVSLTRTEFALLELLVRNSERVLGYDLIMDRVWGYGEAPTSNGLTVFVGHLRRKLEARGRARLIHNVRGVGYVLRAGA